MAPNNAIVVDCYKTIKFASFRTLLLNFSYMSHVYKSKLYHPEIINYIRWEIGDEAGTVV